MASRYQGPTSLSSSKYASPQQKKVQPAAFAAVSLISKPVTENAIATKEQIAAFDSQSAFDMVPKNSDAQLAVAQGNALKQEVDTHLTKFSRSISTAVTNTQQLLDLIRTSLLKVNASELKTVDDLWNELEELFAAATEAKAAFPTFLEKQRNNMGLYHSSMMNETYREAQQELNIQHKKINLQHNLILEHQQAFQDYKEQSAAELREMNGLQERVSRLTLEKGNFRTEIDKYKQLLEQEQARTTEVFKKLDELQKELEKLVTSKEQLSAENEALRSKIEDMEEQKKVAEQAITDQYTAELKSKTEQLAKEGVKATSLNLLANTLKSDESNAKKETEKLRFENKMLMEKYKNQAAEHALAFTSLNEQTKDLKGLTGEVDSLRKENIELKVRLVELAELEKIKTELSQEKSDLQEQVNNLTTEMAQVTDDASRVKSEHHSLFEKVKKLEKDNDCLQIENNNATADHKKVLQTLNVLRMENLKLKSTVEELKISRLAVIPAVVGTGTAAKGTGALEEKIQGLEKQKADLESALAEWTNLAKRSYKEYKDMLPIYKQADHFRKDALEMQEQVNALKLELSTAKASQSNGVGAGSDAAYWKDKYEALLFNVGI